MVSQATPIFEGPLLGHHHDLAEGTPRVTSTNGRTQMLLPFRRLPHCERWSHLKPVFSKKPWSLLFTSRSMCVGGAHAYTRLC